MIVKLRIMSGKRAGAEVSIRQNSFIIGRHPTCDLQIDSLLVSLRHCLITIRTTGVYVCDLGSKNGTFVNGGFLNWEMKIRPTDTLQIGAFLFEFAFTNAEHDPEVGAEEFPTTITMEKVRKANDNDWI